MTNGLKPEKIAQLLTQSTRKLAPETVSALGNARQRALQKQSVHAHSLSLATGRWAHVLFPLSNHQWMLAGLIVVMVAVGAGYWHHAREQQIADLDVAILTDDLPIEVFVD